MCRLKVQQLRHNPKQMTHYEDIWLQSLLGQSLQNYRPIQTTFLLLLFYVLFG